MAEENAAATTSWRELAVARSLDSARTRAENRVQRFLDAALELMEVNDGKEFTVQEVVERSGQSLRSFYQYFGGKHELLLALFEESVRATAVYLRTEVEKEPTPLDRLHRFVVEYYKVCRPISKKSTPKRSTPSPTPVLVEFAQQLLTAHPADASLAYVPLVALLGELLDAAIDSGDVRKDIRRQSLTGIVLEMISFNTFSAAISGDTPKRDRDEAAEEIWQLLIGGIAA
jgi:AcrR family transcriptional regulator